MNNIKEKRLSVGLSREEFAKRLGLSYITLARYENGDREPRVSDLMKMADVLGCTMDALFSNPPHPPTPVPEESGAEELKTA